jgi:sortase A
MRLRLQIGKPLFLATRTLSTVLTLGGLASLFTFGWMRLEEAVYQTTQRAYLDPVQPAVIPAAGPSLPHAANSIPSSSRSLRSSHLNSWSKRDPQLVGRLLIPKLQVDVVIRSGTDDATLRRAVGHLTSTARPGGEGNFIVAGHRDTFFRPLRRIQVNDDIVVLTPEARYTYRVYSISVVSPDYVEVLRQTAEAQCTLITCFPFEYIGRTTRRFIVQARLVEPPEGY